MTSRTEREAGSGSPIQDPFSQMRAVEARVAELREQVTRWIATPEDPKDFEGLRRGTLPASPDDVFWLCERIERVLAVMQDGKTTYGTIDADVNPPKILTPMMVERDALAEALGG